MRFAYLILRSVAVFFLGVALTAAIPISVGPADGQRYRSDIKALTEDRMEGRGDGTKGLTRAKHFLESRYKCLGLSAAGTQGFLHETYVFIADWVE